MNTDLLTREKIGQIAQKYTEPDNPPASVYRIQVTPSFNFAEVQNWLWYFKELGVEALYLSPIFQNVPGSLHGYNIVDPNLISREFGGESSFRNLCAAARESGLKIIIDVVPNHMGISGAHNALWFDVLENGPASIYAHFFDIDWSPLKKELRNKVLIPVLGDQYGRVLERQEIKLRHCNGAFEILYFDHVFPIAPDTYPIILERMKEDLSHIFSEDDQDYLEFLSITTSFRNLPPRDCVSENQKTERNREKEIAKTRLKNLSDRAEKIKNYLDRCVAVFNGEKECPASFDALDHLLDDQSYRLAYWRVASEEINYRRFFEINELAAIRIEHEDVFQYHHHLTFDLLKEGCIDGVRIDHPDGLYDPVTYFYRLQHEYLTQKTAREIEKECGALSETDLGRVRDCAWQMVLQGAKPLLIVAEKILDRKENLPQQWSVHGTVGYDFLNALNGVFVQRDNDRDFTKIYEKFIGEKIDYEQLLYEKKKYFAAFYMASEVNTLAHRLNAVSEQNRHYRDFTLNNLTTALREVIACFPVYRSYIRPAVEEISERDRKYIHIAIEKAKGKHPALSVTVFEFIKSVLLNEVELNSFDTVFPVLKELVLKFQQLTAPIMAKGMEDTAFYIYNRLVSLNEVGGDPFHFGCHPQEFHKSNSDRRAHWPLAFIASSTHDTKRSEDVRYRIDVLSEIPDEWRLQIEKWTRLNKKFKTLVKGALRPERNLEYAIYQTLLGVWPSSGSNEALGLLKERITAYFLKAVREAKVFTNWLNPDQEYEDAVKKFIESLLTASDENTFLTSFYPLQEKMAWFGALNSLSALVLKIASPGILDTYQGTESWNFCLVDPDNRRPVDYSWLKEGLKQVREERMAEGSYAERPKDPWLKFSCLKAGLFLRKQFKELVLFGDYGVPEIVGSNANYVISFYRSFKNQSILTATGRFFLELDSNQHCLSADIWNDHAIRLPNSMSPDDVWTDLLTGKQIRPVFKNSEQQLDLREVFLMFPFAILINLSREELNKRYGAEEP